MPLRYAAYLIGGIEAKDCWNVISCMACIRATKSSGDVHSSAKLKLKEKNA
jgi:hypothetical protein